MAAGLWLFCQYAHLLIYYGKHTYLNTMPVDFTQYKREMPLQPEQPRPIEVAPLPEIPQEIPRETLPREHEGNLLDEAIESLRSKLRRPKKQKPTTIPQMRDELTMKIEKIMEDGLADAYRELTPVQQQEFKLKGEEVSTKIRDLMRHTRVKIKQIFKLLVEWLKLLPGVNRFFVEQEAKIKADRILALKNYISDK